MHDKLKKKKQHTLDERKHQNRTTNRTSVETDLQIQCVVMSVQHQQGAVFVFCGAESRLASRR